MPLSLKPKVPFRNICCSVRGFALGISFFEIIYSLFLLERWITLCLSLEDEDNRVHSLVQCAPSGGLEITNLVLTVLIFKGVYENARGLKKLILFGVLKGLYLCLVTFGLIVLYSSPPPPYLIARLILEILALILYELIVFIHVKRQKNPSGLHLEDPYSHNNNNEEPAKEPEPVNV